MGPGLPDGTTALLGQHETVDELLAIDAVVVREGPGSRAGRWWRMRLELVKHEELRARPRSVWPAWLNRTTRAVCVNTPYPSYVGHVDLPGDAYDGVYRFDHCKGGAE